MAISYDETLIDSIDAGDLSSVREAIFEGANVNLEDSRGVSPLMMATEFGHTEIVEYLIKSGANVNARNSFGFTPLKIAIEEEYPIIIDLIKGAGGTIEGFSNFKAIGTPNETLILAAKGNEVTALQEALFNNALVDARDSIQRTALIYAAQSGHMVPLQILLKNGANIDAVDKFGQTALRAAAGGGYVDAVAFLISLNANVNEKNDRADSILMQYASVRPPPREAMAKKQILIAKLLLDAKANVHEVSDDEDAAPLLMLAATQTHTELVKLLLTYGADPNAQDSFGNTALLAIAHTGPIEIMRLLISAGTNLNLRTMDGYSALKQAMENGTAELVMLLRSAGAKE